MKRRIARKIFNAFYSFKPNYWNGYKGFTICSFFACKNPRLQHALNIAYKKVCTDTDKANSVQGSTSMRHPKYGLWNNF